MLERPSNQKSRKSNSRNANLKIGGVALIKDGNCCGKKEKLQSF